MAPDVRDHKQSMRIADHEPKAINKHGPLSFNGEAINVRSFLIAVASGGVPLQGVFMMQPTEDRLSPDFRSLGQSMPIHRSRPGQGLILIKMLIRWQPGP